MNLWRVDLLCAGRIDASAHDLSLRPRRVAAMTARLLVIGASGLVGTEVARLGAERAEVLGVARTPRGLATRALDWMNAGDVKACVSEFKPTHVAVCAAWPYVDGCERDPDRSERENVGTIRNLLAATADAKILFFSTDHVFDGKKDGPYVESDPVNPLSVYAKHKLAAEKLLLGRGNSLIARTAWVFGAEERRKNFVYRVVDAAKNKTPLLQPEKQAGCPTHAAWLARSSLQLLFDGQEGVVHLTGAQCLTKAEWAQTIADALELGPVDVREVPWAEAGQVAPRPVRVALASSRHSLTQDPAAKILRAHRSAILS